ncbi:MAG: hypothetical protein MUF00_01750 [Gemmatimonadaceae bacterium]|jgi:hypothetical protein|nr:hypothetical protein [Gemmatimonadaceae bacterium]
MKIWRFEDCDIHFIFAETREAADAEYYLSTGAEEPPDNVRELTESDADSVRVHDENADNWTTLGALYRSEPTAGYVCGSCY